MTSSTRFRKIAARDVFFDGAAVDVISGTKTRCATDCSSIFSCLSFSFQKSTGRCLLFDRRVIYGTQMSSAGGFDHYWKMEEHGFVMNAGNCVLVADSRIIWPDAHATCVSYGGHLYVGETVEQMAALASAVSALGNPGRDYRVGAIMDPAIRGHWNWVTGAEVKDVLWSGGQAGTIPTKRCGETALNSPDKLQSDICHRIDRYVCQIPLAH
ncbi:hypothetical protein ACOMHN_016309 [Nucella lapillus]